MVKFARQVLERYVGPTVADFTSADIPDVGDIAEEARWWIAHHFMNSVLRTPFRAPYRQYAANFVRRADAIFRGYNMAREATFSYLEGNDPLNPNVTRLYRAVNAWESLMLNSQIALDLFRRINGSDVFVKGDSSADERIYAIANTVKHHASDIEDGKLDEDDIVPIWLSVEGVETHARRVTYREISVFVREIAVIAKSLEDPLTFVGQKG